MRPRVCVAFFGAAVVAAGCGFSSKPYATAPVSGRITLDGKPLAGARVIFFPIHDPQAGALSGPEAYGITDAGGRYTLTTAFGDPGATVGPTRVTVSTVKYEQSQTDPESIKVAVTERIPKKYFTERGMLKFEVTPKGSPSADFDLTSK
jgi:hypothetical protein